jgi:hypothetical protein
MQEPNLWSVRVRKNQTHAAHRSPAVDVCDDDHR